MIGALQATAMLTLPRRSWAAETPPKMTVTHDPNCGCCGGWVAHVRQPNFRSRWEAADLAKAKLGVPDALISCHTAEVGGYVVEGHVPADAIRRLLAERPRATGLAVAGMPIGSPGMEVSGTLPETYEMVLFGQRLAVEIDVRPTGSCGSIADRTAGQRRLDLDHAAIVIRHAKL
ncbi:MAG: hypothetical protein KDJ71_06515, partial [Nitrobacter sp.]|nr:hypothetical protein [Nitrobacter sp.]